MLTALLFLVAAVLAWRAGRPGEAANQAKGVEVRWWWRLAVLLAMACLWELLGLENRLGALARAVARAHDIYYPRAIFQRVVISMAVAAAAVFLLLLRRMPASRRLLLAAFGLYLSISLVNLVSLHAIDRIADLSWHGLSLVQALKLACAAMTIGGLVGATRTRLEAWPPASP